MTLHQTSSFSGCPSCDQLLCGANQPYQSGEHACMLHARHTLPNPVSMSFDGEVEHLHGEVLCEGMLIWSDLQRSKEKLSPCGGCVGGWLLVVWSWIARRRLWMSR
jgi:hypothetical protein